MGQLHNEACRKTGQNARQFNYPFFDLAGERARWRIEEIDRQGDVLIRCSASPASTY